MSRVSGIILLTIAFIAVFEALARSLFSSPTLWSADISSYLLLCAFMFGMSYTYQIKGHVSVDILKGRIQKSFGMIGLKIITIVGYIVSLFLIGILFHGSFHFMRSALTLHQLTNANIQIPLATLFVIMMIGCILMAITVIFIIIDIFSGDDEYV
jgi:TRAP-type C4-dicarboxylate transport system permease small subunit